MSSSDLTKIVYEELVRMVANAVGVSKWAEDPFENVSRDMEEQYSDVLFALDAYWKNLQECEQDQNLDKISKRDASRKALYAAINIAKNA
jgi:hypothetical protein